MDSDKIDDIYQNMPSENIPWNIETPPKILVDLYENKTIIPCKTIDLGCGIGNYAIYLASNGFNVTGVDKSPTAIKMAKENAKKQGVKCSFRTADILNDMSEFNNSFDFAYDWEVLHHIYPKYRSKYVEKVYKILRNKGKYLSVCFSEKNKQFGGSGKYRETPLGTILYFSSEKEIKELLVPYFNIIELKTIEISGKFAPHHVIFAFMEKK